MTNLNDWSASDLLALYQRIDTHVSQDIEPIFCLDYNERHGWNSEQYGKADMIQFSKAEAKVIMLFSGQEYKGELLVIHLYSIAGQFRQAVKYKVDEAIPAPPAKWFSYIKSFKTNWTPEDKPKKEKTKIKESAIPFPKGNSIHEDPPF